MLFAILVSHLLIVTSISIYTYMQKEYEIQRQKEMLEKGEKINKQTRFFDVASGTTIHMRRKEDEVDYR